MYFLKLCIAIETAVVFFTKTSVQISPKDLYVAYFSAPQDVQYQEIILEDFIKQKLYISV